MRLSIRTENGYTVYFSVGDWSRAVELRREFFSSRG